MTKLIMGHRDRLIARYEVNVKPPPPFLEELENQNGTLVINNFPYPD
jgi:hypothetical protein